MRLCLREKGEMGGVEGRKRREGERMKQLEKLDLKFLPPRET